MKRDMDLIRKILLKVEEYIGDDPIQNIQIEGHTEEDIAYNIYLLENAGLIEGKTLFGMDSVKPAGYAIFRLNWKGHEFLDASRDDKRWKQAKEIMGKLGGASLDMVMVILTELMKKQVLGI